jgi:hypothetical protein
MHHPNPPEPTPAAREAAAGHRRGRPRRPRPGPPGFTIEVQVLGGEAGRRLAQEQTEAVAAVLAWLAGHPPTATAAAGSAASAVIGTPGPAEVGDADRDAAGPSEPGRGSGCEHAAQDGRDRGAPTPKPRELLRGQPKSAASQASDLVNAKNGITPFDCPGDKPLRQAGQPGRWRVVIESSGSGSGPGGGAEQGLEQATM